MATLGPLVWVVEVKRSVSLALLEQAHNWTRYAHRVSIASPRAKRRVAGRGYAIRACKADGIGVLEVSDPSRYGGVREAVAPKTRRRIIPGLRDVLEPEHKTFAAAGNADGKFWSTFKRTCRDLVEVVTKRPGLTLREAIAEIEHHYASPKSAVSSLTALIPSGVVEGVEFRGSGKGHRRLYPIGWQGPIAAPAQLPTPAETRAGSRRRDPHE